MLQTIGEDAFSTVVLTSAVPVLVHFWAPWCGLCRLVEPLVDHALKASSLPLRVVGINADESLKLASQYRLRVLPTLLLFHNGEVVGRLEGFHDRQDIQRRLTHLLHHVRTVSSPQLVDRHR